jgi:hypothetical protein
MLNKNLMWDNEIKKKVGMAHQGVYFVKKHTHIWASSRYSNSMENNTG